jgi:predicted nucleic acid-binding Zn ribbon protein
MIANVEQQKRPVSLTIICILCMAVIALAVLLYIRQYDFYTSISNDNNPNVNQYPAAVKAFRAKWELILIFLQLPIITGVVLMYFLKRIGFWIFLAGKIIFFVLPFVAGTGDDVLGLALPLFFIESATFVILFGKRIQYMS